MSTHIHNKAQGSLHIPWYPYPHAKLPNNQTSALIPRAFVNREMTEISLSFITCVYFNTISTRKLKYSYRRDLTKANRRKKKKKKERRENWELRENTLRGAQSKAKQGFSHLWGLWCQHSQQGLFSYVREGVTRATKYTWSSFSLNSHGAVCSGQCRCDTVEKFWTTNRVRSIFQKIIIIFHKSCSFWVLV